VIFLSILSAVVTAKTGVIYHCSVGQKNRYLAEEDVSKGILNNSLVHPREVFA
jgi:DNA repair protein RadC